MHTTSQSSGFNFDTKRFLFDLLHFWWLFAITIPIALATVFLIHRWTLPTYRASISLLIEERGEKMPTGNMMEGFGLTPGQQNMENQMAILTSWDVVKETVDQLDFHLSYFISGRVKHTEMYGSGEPFKVVFDSLHNQILNTPIHIEIINQDQYRLKLNTESASTYNYRLNTSGINLSSINIEQTYRFGEVVDANWGRFKIENTKGTTASNQEMYFVFNHPNNIAAHYKSRLRTYRANESSSIIRVSVTGKNNQKNITFLNQLAKVFIANNLEQKNQIATNTIAFIEEQLGVISDSLFLTGSQLSQFRTDNRIQSVSAKAEYLFNGLQDIEQQLAQHEITKRYYNYLKNYFSDNITGNDVIAPAQYDIENNLLAEQIRQIMELNSQRLRLTYSEDQNLFNRDIETQINIATQTLIKTINSQLDVLNETIARLQATKSKNEQELYTLPETERKLLGIERKFELSNEVYTFLLRKRSESQIQKASNTPDHQILEAAQGNGIIAPNISSNRKNAFLLGLILPLAFVGLRQLLNNKILAEEDINKITDIPVIGQVLHNTKEESNVIQHHPKSVITESFRRVRTRLDYLTQDIPCPVVSVSSSIPGEGKTFCALNIAAALAISGKKTAILGFDLRKPGLNKLVDTKGKTGLSHYLIGKASYDEIKIPHQQENLTIIPSGDIPPNPSELISSEKTQTLMDELKKEFDIIIMDTPPMGIVSDPFLLARHADSLIFLVRQNHSIKKITEQTLKNISDEGIKNVGILMNDLNMKKGYGYGYNYRYNYGYRYTYGHGYYEN
ncbi:polysaccharide biosynthesis tyrosine autokinase [Carboxylicivirga linearis]|uniref:non-specific protein-tyrosine kinase n=1 Tax=Carboxylicivirga linearis TaxID=1628157 RepID=A0ABS5JUF2_9BACT|nr:polysaccharide biosynthesis tyrosine autokinase [Carboxylicivirga linearis]